MVVHPPRPNTSSTIRLERDKEDQENDILKYIGPTLQRHEGCDLVDINPGAGLWSRKLHDVLKPRQHILMEPDASLYTSFLEPLLARPNTKLIPSSGLLWNELGSALAHVDNQTPRPKGPGITPERNDTLLVTANLSLFPKKRYGNFESIAGLVLFQLLNSIHTGQLFQKYGLVRMLVWTGSDDYQSILPKFIQARKKVAMEAEATCEWIAPVAVPDVTEQSGWYARDRWIDVDSTTATLARMKENGMAIPKGRKMESTKRAEPYVAGGKRYAGTMPPDIYRPYLDELEELAAEEKSGKITKESDLKKFKRLVTLRSMAKKHSAEPEVYKALLDELYDLGHLRQQGIPEKEISERERAWNEKVMALNKNEKIDFRLVKDNAHIFLQDPPVLLWDKRPYEPIAAKANEFYPNVGCTLLDIQPKAMHPLLREIGPESSRAGDLFELIQRSMMGASLDPVSKALERIWPGASDGILPHCPSLRDPARGGLPGSGQAELCPRMMNQEQWAELLEAFMSWPFRPRYEELIGRLTESSEPEDEDDDVGAGSSFSAAAALN
ncbi:hypothetical protein CGCF415_v012926 [Colletotrichum fructicola]|nr:hypothetical protein CGCF415_v012926 [Colletotrichum fructicola]KAF4927679.1 hypothetical protein CGCF245_v013044 [Colletotrichum fructicola]KAI8273674.1 hypothetical protein K4K60_010534 [Colletotrichum sp. SAR11_57]